MEIRLSSLGKPEMKNRNLVLAKDEDVAVWLGGDEDVTALDAETGAPLFIYRANQRNPELMRAFMGASPTRTTRQSGISGSTVVFGYMPRKLGRQDWCRATSAHADPVVARATVAAAERFDALYKAHNPAVYEQHRLEVEKVLADYRMGSSVFTSGIANYDFRIPYHYDAGNIQGSWSAMLVWKRDVDGGDLVIPEYGIGLRLAHNSLLMFGGGELMHGVTPIQKKTKSAFRISAVWYSLRDMWRCLPPEEEVAAARSRMTEREKRRAQ